jgi:ADP-ribose pyrophosphatase YjhB (NUDIX family)
MMRGVEPRIVAAGVIVVDGDRILAFARSDKPGYALPCGHVEDGEEPAAAALREAFEETGLELVLDESAGPYVGFDPRGGKQVAMYLARVVGGTLRETDLDEGRPCWTQVVDVVDGPYGDYNRAALRHFKIAF